MAEYDPTIIEEFADKLYSKAMLVQVFVTLLGSAVGLGAGWATRSEGVIAIGGLFGTLVGLAIGRAMAFSYKLQAQMALCQIQIEKNTRTGTRAEAAAAK